MKNTRSMSRGDLLRIAPVLPDADLRDLFTAIAENNGPEMGAAVQRLTLRLNKGNDALMSLNMFLSIVS